MENLRQIVEQAIENWLMDKQLPENDRQAHHSLVSGVADAVLTSVSCRLEQPETPDVTDQKLSRLLPLLLPLATALLALLGAWLGGPLGAFLAVWLAYAGSRWLKSARCRECEAQPVLELMIDQTSLEEQLEEIAFLTPEAQRDAPEKRDLLDDESFHRWIQQFALKVHRRGDYNDRQILMSLKDTLENYGLYLYDELEKDEEGNVVLPPLEDAYMDMREGDAWTAVTLPALYSREQVLLCGVIK